MKFSPEIVTMCLDLYFKGISLRKIAHHIGQTHNGLEISHVQIYYWIQRFTKIVSEYADTLVPSVGNLWHSDEMMVKIREGESLPMAQGKTKYVWLWNCMDADTRFLLANQVTTRRGIKDVRTLFKKAKEVADKYPKTVITDGLPTYPRGFKKEFVPRKTGAKLIAGVGLKNKTPNNRVERLNQSVRQREKVMRGMQNVNTSDALMDAYRTHYNFVRPHMALDGKTPSEVAGINLNLGDNKWKGLIEKAIKNKRVTVSH
jgi:transposase-like protein